MSTPQTTINVCSGVRLDPRYEHTIYFDNQADQYRYFEGKVVKTFSSYSYIRKHWPLKVQATMEQARTWNYLFFRNSESAKIYYYFITDIEYINDSTVELSLELDVMQTYLKDFTLLPCFIERQHSTTDKVGENLVDEGLDTGEMTVISEKDSTIIKDLCVLTLATFNPNYANTGTPIQALSGTYNGVFSGLRVWGTHQTKFNDLGDKLDELAEAGFLDGIVSMWMYPVQLVEIGTGDSWSDDYVFNIVKEAYPGGLGVSFMNQPTDIGGYIPKNNKLFCYPYNMMVVTNNNGETACYHFERFKDPANIKFNLFGGVTAESGVYLAPCYYNSKTVENNWTEGLHLGGFPTCAWDSDIYKMWLAQNQNQNSLTNTMGQLAIGAGAVTAIGSLLTGNLGGVAGGAGMAIGGAQQIASLNAQKKDREILPPQAKGSFSSSVNITAGKQLFTAKHIGITKEYARIIDDYFTMYGYRMKRVATPNINARPCFTYVKTIGCLISGKMCTDDIVKIETIFDNGITFWKDGDKIGDYSQDNSVE